MTPSMLAELERIARYGDVPIFSALDKLANSMQGYTPPAPSAGGAMTTKPAGAAPTVQPSSGATNMAGMSVHCDRCFATIKQKGVKACPSCGNPIKGVLDLKSGPEDKSHGKGSQHNLESGETGGEAAVAEELEDGSYSSGKYAAVHPLIMKLRGAAAIAAGGYGGVKGAKALKDLEKKARASHSANPVLNMKRRGGSLKSVDAFRKKFKNSARKFTVKGLALVR